MNTGISTKIPASDQVVVPVMFTPKKTGYYFVDVENGFVSSVQKLAAQESAQARMRGTGTSSNAGDTQYFEVDTSYMIYIYTNKKESTVTIRKVHANGKQLQEPLLKHPVQPVHPANRNAKFITIHVWLKVIKQPVTVTVHGK